MQEERVFIKAHEGGKKMTKHDIMTAEEIAETLRIKQPTLYDHRWKEQSGCPLFKQGKRLFARKNEFDSWYKGRIQYV